MDLDPVHFVLLGVEQDRFAHAAGIIHGIVLRPKNGRGVQNDAGGWRFDYFEADPTRDHDSGSRLCLVPKQEFGCYCATVHAFEAVNGEVRAGLMGRDNRGL